MASGLIGSVAHAPCLSTQSHFGHRTHWLHCVPPWWSVSGCIYIWTATLLRVRLRESRLCLHHCVVWRGRSPPEAYLDESSSSLPWGQTGQLALMGPSRALHSEACDSSGPKDSCLRWGSKFRNFMLSKIFRIPIPASGGIENVEFYVT